MMLLPFAFILLIFAGVFAWQGINGLRTGRTYIPVIMFRDDDYVRGDSGFGFAIFINFFGAIASLGIALVIWIGSS